MKIPTPWDIAKALRFWLFDTVSSACMLGLLVSEVCKGNKINIDPASYEIEIWGKMAVKPHVIFRPHWKRLQ